MRQLSSTIRLILIFVLGVFIALFFYIGLYMPKVQRIAVMNEDVEAARRSILALKQQIGKLKRTTDFPEMSQEVSPGLLKQFPSKNDLHELLTNWSKQGQKLGIDVLLFEPQKEKPMGPLIEMPIKMTVKGSFHQTLEFFRYLTTQDRKLIISKLEMKKPEKRKGYYVISTNTIITTYRRTGRPK